MAEIVSIGQEKTDVIFVQATLEELEAVRLVDQGAFGNRTDWWNVDLWKGMLKSFGCHVILAKLESNGTATPVGFAVTERGGKVMKLAVLPQWQNKGIGAKLLDKVLAVLDSGGEHYKYARSGASLHVDPANVAALGLYISRGFEVDSTVRDYYCAGRDALRMLRARR